MNRCLRQGFCSSWKYVFVCVLFFSSFYHIKTGQSDSGPPIFHPSLHRSSLQWTPFVLWGEIQSYTLCASLTEKSVNQPSDFSGSFRKILLPFNKQSGPPGWGQREAREVGRQKENRAERNTETKEEVDSFLTKFWRKKKQREKKKQVRSVTERREDQNFARQEEKSWEWGCESTQLSGNPRVHTVFQSKSIDLAGLWQIIPAALHMTQSAWRIAFWWAIGLLVYQPNHPLMTPSTHSLHFSKRTTKANLEINSYLLSREHLHAHVALHSFISLPLFGRDWGAQCSSHELSRAIIHFLHDNNSLVRIYLL